MDNSQSFQYATANITHERLDGEVIAVHLGTGRYYSMSGSAADTWFLIGAGATEPEMCVELAKVFKVNEIDISTDISRFVLACKAASLIEAAEVVREIEITSLPEDHARSKWVAPVLEEFDDLQDLILVDPIHDASILGWPHLDPSITPDTD